MPSSPNADSNCIRINLCIISVTSVLSSYCPLHFVASSVVHNGGLSERPPFERLLSERPRRQLPFLQLSSGTSPLVGTRNLIYSSLQSPSLFPSESLILLLHPYHSHLPRQANICLGLRQRSHRVIPTSTAGLRQCVPYTISVERHHWSLSTWRRLLCP